MLVLLLPWYRLYYGRQREIYLFINITISGTNVDTRADGGTFL